MEMRSLQLYVQFKKLQILAWKKIFRSSTGFKPMAFVLVLQCSTNWAMKIHMLAADQFIKLIFTHDRNEMWNEVDFNSGNTVEMEMWSSQLYFQFKKLQILARKKIFRAPVGFEPMASVLAL